jgi:hypothetical protein
MLRNGNGEPKELVRGDTLWPVSFSPDSTLLLYVYNVMLSEERTPVSLFTYDLNTGKTEQLTNNDPNLGTLNNDEYRQRYVTTPFGEVTWNGNIISYVTRSVDGNEVIEINLEKKELKRAPKRN